MTQHKFIRTTAVAVAIVAVLSAVSVAYALEDIRLKDTKTFTVGAAPELDISAINGDVTYTVVEGTEAKVEILTEVRAENEEEAQRIQEMIEINVDGGDGFIEASVKHPDDFWSKMRHKFGRDREISVSFHISGPRGASGRLASVSGDVDAKDVTGPLKMNAVSGNILARNIGERLEAKSVSGDVDVSDCGGRVTAKNVSGDIIVANCGGSVTAGTTSGEIRLSGVEGGVFAHTTSGDIDIEHRSGDLSAETVSGDITARSESSDGDLEVESLSGSVELYADTDKIGRIALSTFSGDIHMKDDPTNGKRARKGFNGRGDLHLTLGNGNLDVRAKTHSGDIWVREL